MRSIFVSYSSKDMDAVIRITTMLSKHKISYFKAPESIPAGSNYAREIPAAIKECAVFLLVISENSQNSIWVEKEIDCAINMRKLIIPVKICRSPLSDMFMFYLNNVQIINYAENPTLALEQLRIRLGMFAAPETEEIKPSAPELQSPIEEKQAPKSALDKELEELQKKNASKNRVVRYKEAQPTGEADAAARSTINMFIDEHTSRSQMMRGMVSFSVSDPAAHRSYALKMNAVSVNKMPVVCTQCAGDLIQIHRGTYRCIKCGYHNFDYFQKIRNFLAENGAKPATVISDETGVPRNAVEYFLLEENLEIPINSPVMLSCNNCGAPIRSGRLCEKCKNNNVKLTDAQKHMGPQYRFAGTKPAKS